jgi:hypothetical protein
MSNVGVPTPALLNGIPPVNVPDNLRVALTSGRRLSTILREVVALRRGTEASSHPTNTSTTGCGKLT